jgi:hypothetical protein
MREIRNAEDRLVCRIDEAAKVVEICVKGYCTLIEFKSDGEIVIVNTDRS